LELMVLVRGPGSQLPQKAVAAFSPEARGCSCRGAARRAPEVLTRGLPCRRKGAPAAQRGSQLSVRGRLHLRQRLGSPGKKRVIRDSRER